MSEFLTKVVTIDAIAPHNNADSLELAYVWGYPVIVRKGEYQPGALASYIPVDAVLPSPDHDPEFESVYKYTRRGRVVAAKLRGQVSHGLLWRVPPTFAEGDDIAGYFGIVKFDDSAPARGFKTLPSDAEPDPGLMPKYDVENVRRWPGVLIPGEEVVVTEKLHGTNFRAVHDGTRLWVGSRNLMVRPDSDSLYARVARQYGLEERLAAYPNVALYGEVIGVQDLAYGLKNEVKLYLFDAYLTRQNHWYDWIDLTYVCDYLAIPHVPLLHRGNYSEGLHGLADGTSLIANHIREGAVIKPVYGRTHEKLGRVILKCVSDQYLLRKEAA